jgi:hypothetical protein
MTTRNNGDTRLQDVSLIIRSAWSTGPRTTSWDTLWRKMLAGLGPVPPTDAREQLETEAGDA